MERGELKFTYYLDHYRGAFNFVGIKHVEGLRARGYHVEVRNIHDWLVHFKHRAQPTNNFAVVHPLFFTERNRTLAFLKKLHRYIIAIEVADTTKLSRDAVEYANDPRINTIFLPSSFAIEAYHRSGVVNRIWHVPHGVSVKYELGPERIKCSNETVNRLEGRSEVKILTFMLHSPYRKGRDVMIRALERLGGRWLLVVKTFPPPHDRAIWEEFRRHKIPVYPVNSWLTEEEVIRLYDVCDIYLAPFRGGSFELNPMEAMARGLPTVVTAWGPALEYASFHNAYLIRPRGVVKVFPENPRYHIGEGADPDPDDCLRKLQFILDNLDYCKKRAQHYRGSICSYFNWDNTVERFIMGCSEVWARD